LRKKAHISPSTPKSKLRKGNENTEEDTELVPSSQSDEHELTVPKLKRRDRREVQENVENWRREAAVHSTPPKNRSLLVDNLQDDITAPMDMDEDHVFPVSVVQSSRAGVRPEQPVSFSSPLSPLTSSPAWNNFSPTRPKSADEVSAALREFSPLPSPSSPSSALTTPHAGDTDLPTPSDIQLDVGGTFLVATPQPSSPGLPAPVAPVAIDAKKKTEQIIAQIRTDAAKAVQLSPESDGLKELFDLDDSSSEDEAWPCLSGKNLVTKR